MIMATSTIKGKRKLLWTNPNPSAAFSSQSISLDLTGFAYIQVDFGQLINVPIGGDAYASTYNWVSGKGNLFIFRGITVSANRTAVSIGNAYLMGIGTSTTQESGNTEYLKPQAIYGIY